MRREPLRFPAGFLWGTASSAHQVEGDNRNNQWWAWEQRPGAIWRGDTSGAACGWWYDCEADFDRMQVLGTNAHRMSLEWSRIEPEDGRFDAAALARYRAMLSGLQRRGITPMVTLHHFTEPSWLARRGGWRHPATPERFARFVDVVMHQLGDLCQLWCTINEPSVYAVLGYALGVWPPGARSLPASIQVVRQLLRGHRRAVQVIHAHGTHHQVGVAHHTRIYDPATPGKRDVLVSLLYDFFANGIVLRGLGEGCDFIGLNYYSRDHVSFDARAPHRLFARRFIPERFARSDLGVLGEPFGEIYPAGMERALRRLWHRLRLPVYITETGLPDARDRQRPRFLIEHLAAIHRACAAGVDVRGVFVWTLVDNFEWAEGWGQRFGLYALDRTTGARRLRRSGALYAAIARANACPPPGTL
ncbi:MAG: family 1 glycosylhydrolase [Chloroflexi bacterium]|nr:family 1 glycosylhydrolase [Chloroflexota bacterium]